MLQLELGDQLGTTLADPASPRRIAVAGRPGAYPRLVREGSVAAGDEVLVIYRPYHEVTVALVAHAYHADRSQVPRLLEVPQLSSSLRDWSEKILRTGQHKTEYLDALA